ncbi:MAG TPA: 30S ribosomal protein S4 [Candidatus Paceibacterota bacterium]|nr:30S ribosomal protein S4 [Candidatus Paceibacterota bacterium]
MKIGPKFKIARRLGAPVFEKTQTTKFKLSADRKSKGGRPRARSDYGQQLLEKQKARFSYGISEKQFGNYVNKVIGQMSKVPPQERLFSMLERRLDNVAYRLGLAKTRLAARQMVSHGHLTVNGRKVTIPSFQVSVGDKIGIRAGSAAKALFQDLDEKLAEQETPNWLNLDIKTKTAEVKGVPQLAGQSLVFDLGSVLEFYKR